MSCVLDAHYIASILQHYVLKSTTGSEQRHPVFPGEAHAFQRTIETFVRTARRTPEGIETSILVHFIGRNPLPAYLDSQRTLYMLESVIRLRMRWESGIIIADDADLQAGHIGYYVPSPSVRLAFNLYC